MCINEPHFKEFKEPGDDAGRLPDNVVDSATVQVIFLQGMLDFNQGRLLNASVKYTRDLFLFPFV